MNNDRINEIRERCEAATEALRSDHGLFHGVRHISEEASEVVADLLDEMLAEVDRLNEAQRWIPVTKRLPECRKSVLVYCQKYNNIYCASIHEDGTWWHFAHGNYPVCEEVTRWMPLPAAPKGEWP